MLISPVWNKILKIWDTLFELMHNRKIIQEKLVKHFLPQESGAFRNNIEKQPQKARPKLKKYVCYIFTEHICSVYNPMQVVLFAKMY